MMWTAFIMIGIMGIVVSLVSCLVAYQCGCCGCAFKTMSWGCRSLWVAIQGIIVIGAFFFMLASISEQLTR